MLVMMAVMMLVVTTEMMVLVMLLKNYYEYWGTCQGACLILFSLHCTLHTVVLYTVLWWGR